ncbi:MAG: hypothetical protein EOP35_09195 [Rubrivivax sp.]|nr:MAG: hypothetical protein EOP35_09195 [Rubrivivax sp.]
MLPTLPCGIASEPEGWLAALPEAVLVSRDGRVAYANDAAHRLFAAAPGDRLPGRPLVSLLTADDGSEEVRGARLDGSGFSASVKSEPVSLAGEPAFLLLVRDADTERALKHRLESQRAELLALSGRLIQLQEHERRHIARELHDEIGQCLSAIRVQFAKLKRRIASADVLTLIDSAASMTERTLGSVRSLSLMLHPPQLDTLGLPAALRWHLAEQQKVHGVDIVFEAGPLDEPLPPELAIAAYRIVQESLSNSLRHARARHVTVSLHRRDNALKLAVSDDGIGFDAERIRASVDTVPTLGLLSMTERARLLGGELSVTSAPGQGTQIAARLPFPTQADHDDTPGDAGG